MKIKLRDIERSLAPHGLIVVEKKKYDSLNTDFYLHEYASYEEYRQIQIFHNKRKINNIWADGSSQTKGQTKGHSLCLFEVITFEPNPALWHYYASAPTTLIKKGVAGKTEGRRFTLDEIDGDGSSFVVGKAIDYRKIVKNEDFKTIEIECIDICEVIESLRGYQKLILKLDVEGAEYEILEKLLERGLMGRVSKLYAEWHWHKIGMSQEQHIDIYNRVEKYCPIREWDALDMSIHEQRDTHFV